jgi:hypothetical protein
LLGKLVKDLPQCSGSDNASRKFKAQGLHSGLQVDAIGIAPRASPISRIGSE